MSVFINKAPINMALLVHLRPASSTTAELFSGIDYIACKTENIYQKPFIEKGYWISSV